MPFMHILGFFCSMLIGLSLGLIGGGGSILTLPVLVYLLGINPLLSSTYSLFVVGTISFVGSVNYMRRQQIHYRVALLFSIPSFVAIFLTRRYVIPGIPDSILITESIRVTKEFAFMLFFALIMQAASVLMILDRKTESTELTDVDPRKFWLLGLTGLFVGSLTGLAGIGGGFLIIPTLVLLVRLPMKNAVGTSLLIIAANSLIGFLGNPVWQQIDWSFLLGFTALAMLGIGMGSYVSQYISGSKLRKLFGWSVLNVSISILGKETLMPIVARSPVVQPFPGKPAQPLWKAPDVSETAQASSVEIRYGRELIARTAYYLGPKGKVARLSNGMNCQNCHLDAGTKPWGNHFGAVASTYPKFRERSGTSETIVKRISDCMERSLNGHPPDSTSREMRAMVAYIQFIGHQVPKGEIPKGAGLWPLPFLDRAADPVKGRVAYQQRCVSCHGLDGEGKLQPDSSGFIYPPLWGKHSYTTGAGLYRLSRLAGYIKANMPLGSHWNNSQLTDEEAWDLAAYINSRPRPARVFPKDWPNLKGKPVDHPYGPYADSFPEKQHKFGPFKPILKASQK
jgi:thiosulfate dehydrogenase